ncbi:MAG: hypothetical protein ACJARS_003570, partial [bacterium]
ALYDLLADPYEAMDLSSDPDMAAVRDRLRDEALVLRGETSR